MSNRAIAHGVRALYNALPGPVAAVASEAYYRSLSEHPIVFAPPGLERRLARGAVVFSIDFEMAWAWRFARQGAEGAVARGLRERAQVPIILGELERAQVPATWATVGHLFLSSCSRDGSGTAHSHVHRPPHFTSRSWSFLAGDWFQHDPCTDVRHDPAWYAPDLLDAILKSPVPHEIGCHSFSHVGFHEDHCPPEVATSDLDACFEAMRPFGLKPVSWVFPGNEVGNLAALASKGLRILRAFPGCSPDISLPVLQPDGTWFEHASLHVESRPGFLSWTVHLKRLKSYLDAAMREKMAAHIWFHPSMSLKNMEHVLFPLLRHCASLRDKGLLDIFTMKDLVRAAYPDAPRLEDRLHP